MTIEDNIESLAGVVDVLGDVNLTKLAQKLYDEDRQSMLNSYTSVLVPAIKKKLSQYGDEAIVDTIKEIEYGLTIDRAVFGRNADFVSHSNSGRAPVDHLIYLYTVLAKNQG